MLTFSRHTEDSHSISNSTRHSNRWDTSNNHHRGRVEAVVRVAWAHAWRLCAVAALLKKDARLVRTAPVFALDPPDDRQELTCHRLRRGMLLSGQFDLYFIPVYRETQTDSSGKKLDSWMGSAWYESMGKGGKHGK